MKDNVKKLIAAVECSMALDMPHAEGLAILQSHGFDFDNRFNLPATKFVKNLQEEALKVKQLEEK